MNIRICLAIALLAAHAAAPAQWAPAVRQLYWVDPSPLIGGIWTGAADASSRATKIYSTGKNPDGLAVEKAARRVYWTNMTLLNSSDASVQRGDLVGGQVKNVISIVPEGWGLRTPKQLKLDEVGRKVYFAEREGRRIYRAPMDGAKVKADLEIMVDYTSQPESAHQFVGVEIDASRKQFYWTDRLTNTIWRAPADLGFPITPLNVAQYATKVVSYTTGMITDLSLDAAGRYLYWADRGEGNELIGETLPAGFIARVALDVPEAPIQYLATGLLKDPVGIAIDPQRGTLYFANTEDGRVFSMPITGGTPKELHRSVLAAGLELVDWDQ